MTSGNLARPFCEVGPSENSLLLCFTGLLWGGGMYHLHILLKTKVHSEESDLKNYTCLLQQAFKILFQLTDILLNWKIFLRNGPWPCSLALKYPNTKTTFHSTQVQFFSGQNFLHYSCISASPQAGEAINLKSPRPKQIF